MHPTKHLERPSKEAMRALPPFPGLPLERICLVRTEREAALAHAEIAAAGRVGFDTESKPTFFVGQLRTGPHLIQFATPSQAFLFPADSGVGVEALRQLIGSEAIAKIGFGLSSDCGPVQSKLGVPLRQRIELAAATRRLGFKQQVGLQTAVAVVLGQYLQKSRKVTTSNWAARRLSPAQLLYAANDAYASLCVYLELLQQAPQVLEAARADLPRPGIP